ncbi:MAG: 2-C-methyl-D-erythritol 4-phosphate cytidylyltransferase [Candidatus Brocadiia bacterium]
MPDGPTHSHAPSEVSFAVVVPAAGIGVRMGRRKKPYLTLAGRPILDHTIARLRRAEGCEQIVVVVHESDCRDSCLAAHLEEQFAVTDLVCGGSTRQASVWAGLQAVRDDLDLVLTHDAVRPMVAPGVVRRVAEAARRDGAAIAAIPARETVKEVDEGGIITGTPPRRRLWYARTPQGFHKELIVKAHRQGRADGCHATDDAQLVERLDEPVTVVEDNYDNLKITTEEDLLIAEAILDWQESGAGLSDSG